MRQLEGSFSRNIEETLSSRELIARGKKGYTVTGRVSLSRRTTFSLLSLLFF